MNTNRLFGRSQLAWLALACSFIALAASAPAHAVKPTITSANTTTFTVGQPGTFTITATGDLPMRIYINGRKLPAGVTLLDNGDGTATLAGTPVAGSGRTYNFKLNARNASGKDMQNFSLVVNQAPVFTSPDNLTCLVGSLCSLTVATTGFPAATITRSALDALPANMTFVNNGNGTGTLTGTPILGTQGVYHFTFTAANGVVPDATQNFTLTINRFLNFTSADSGTCTVGTLCTFNITATGVPLPTLSHPSGALPADMTFVANGPGSATLSGTPQAGTGGVWHPVFVASNGAEPDATQNFTLTVNEAPSFTSPNATSCAVGIACLFNVTTGGYPPPAIARTNDPLPSGVTFTDDGDGTGTLVGNPDPGTEGAYPFGFTASNGIGTNATQNFTLTVNASLAITSADSTTCVVGTPCSFNVTTVGGGTITLTQSNGAPPSAITFTDQGGGAGLLAGTADVGTGGVYHFKITAANGAETFGQNFTLTVNEAPSITSANNKTCVVGTACTFTVTTLGYPVPAIGETGALGGLTFIDNADSTATLSGTASLGAGGVHGLTISATNGIGSPAQQSFTLTLNEAPTITSAPPPDGAKTVPYTHQYTAYGYPAPTYSVTAGSLPSPLVLSPSGAITGTPDTAGLSTGTVTATNGIGADATQNFSITISVFAPASPPLNVSALAGNAQATVSFSPPANDGGSPVLNYTATCTPTVGSPVSTSGPTSPITVTSLTNGVTYTCTVHANTLVGPGDESGPSNPVTPSASGPATLTVIVNGSGTGSVTSVPTGIDCPGTCSAQYPAGTGVILTAVPTGGSVFMGWLGGGCDLAPVCMVTVDTALTVTATFAPPGTTGNLDIDASAPSTKYDAPTDGLLVLRHLFGMTGTTLTGNATGGTAQRNTAQIEQYLADILPRLDIDGNGIVDGLTDGVLVMRYMFGLTGDALIQGAIGPGATRTTPGEITTRMQLLTP